MEAHQSTAAESRGQILDVPSYGAMIRAAAAARPDVQGLVIGDDVLTYAGLLERARLRSRQLAALGLAQGDRVGLLLPNSLAFVEFLAGAALAGITVVPMNVRFKTTEITHLVRDAGMKAIVTTTRSGTAVDFAGLLEAALEGLAGARDPFRLQVQGAPDLAAVVLLGREQAGFVDEAALQERCATAQGGQGEAVLTGDEPLLLLYTSGTTAKPKGCVISSRALVGTALTLAARYDITSDDVWWCPLPMFHVGGILFMTIMFARAGRYVGMEYFDAGRALEQVETFQPTVFYPLFPPISLAVLDHPRFAATDFSSVRFVFSVATSDVQKKIQSAFPSATLCSAFGMTETCGAVTFSRPDDSFDDRIGTCGTALPGWQVRVADIETGLSLATGERGEIQVRGIGLFDHYLNDPESTKRQFTEDGFFKTGDIGSLDASGRLRFHGRFKDQLKVGGENVSALEVESFLCSHPAVKQAQVVGVADQRLGEVPAAFIELAKGATLTQEDVLSYCDGRIARFKVPRYVRFVTEWPMSATKVMKHRLREVIAAEVGSATSAS